MSKKSKNKPTRQKPLFKGLFFGQCTYTTTVVDCMVVFEKAPGEFARFKSYKNQGTIHYVWNGDEWITPESFDIGYSPRPKGIIRCKNNYNALGEKIR